MALPKWSFELLNIESWNSQWKKLFVRHLFEPNLLVLRGGANPNFGGSLPKGPQIWSKQLSQKQFPTLWISTFYVEQFKNLTLGGHFWGGGRGFATASEEPQIWSPGKPRNLVQTIVSQTTFYIVSFNLCSAVQKFHFKRAIFGEAGVCHPEDSNLVQTIVWQTTSYIMSFNFLCWAVQKFHFRRAILGDGFASLQGKSKFGPLEDH